MKRVVAAMIVVCCAAGVQAQDTDSQMMLSIRNGAAPTDAEGQRFTHKFGLCAARAVPNYSRQVLGRLPDSDASNKALFWMATGSNSCAKHEETLRYSPRFLRGKVAEYYLASDFDLAGGKSKKRPLKIFDAPANTELEGLSPGTRSAVVMIETGGCVARANPAGVARLFATEAASDEEKTAFADISSAIAGCVPGGVEMKMSKFQLRGFLAEGAYRTAVAAQTGQS